jgi:hypothetical protein
VHGTLASIVWVAETPYKQWGALIGFPAGYAFGHDRFTAPAFRGRGLQGYASLALLETMTARGFEGMLGSIDVTNDSSVKGVRKVGYRPVGWVMEARLGRRSWTFLSRRARRFGFTILAESEAP